MSSSETFSTLVHEYAHILLHHHGPKNRTLDRSVRELEADAVACVVREYCGIDCLAAGTDYIQMWDGDKRKLFEWLEWIRNCASRIIGMMG